MGPTYKSGTEKESIRQILPSNPNLWICFSDSCSNIASHSIKFVPLVCPDYNKLLGIKHANLGWEYLNIRKQNKTAISKMVLILAQGCIPVLVKPRTFSPSGIALYLEAQSELCSSKMLALIISAFQVFL